MISGSHRFRGRKGLTYLHSKGVVVRAQGASLKYTSNDRRSAYRAAVVVSKKVHKSAVVRNRIRRRVYEQIRLLVPEDLAVDLAIMVYDVSFATMPAPQLKQVIFYLLQKASLIRG